MLVFGLNCFAKPQDEGERLIQEFQDLEWMLDEMRSQDPLFNNYRSKKYEEMENRYNELAEILAN